MDVCAKDTVDQFQEHSEVPRQCSEEFIGAHRVSVEEGLRASLVEMW